MNSSVAFFTVTHYKDYDFLLGSIEHHAKMGYHLILDTSPHKNVWTNRTGLPETVRWVHEPLYGSGWKQFKMRSAVERALHLAKEFGTDVLASLDSDEFYSGESPGGLFPHAARGPVSVHCTHWKSDGPYMFGDSEWHLRLWPRDCEVRIEANVDWTRHPEYNGNPEHHPVPVPPPGRPELRVPGNFHHHVHYACSDGVDTDAGASMISGWPDGGARVPLVEWPARLRMWHVAGIRPSSYYQGLEYQALEETR